MRLSQFFGKSTSKPKSEPKPEPRPDVVAEPDALGSLWIDQPDAMARLERLGLDAQTRADVHDFIERGYVIFRNCVAPDLADRVLLDTHAIFKAPERFVVRDKGIYIDPAGIQELNLGHRIIDLYAVSAAARDAIFASRAASFLHAIFGEPALGIQSLSFEYGSQQAIHQDTAYVVSSKPLALAASWLALEDVEEGTGELIYYPGGHRFPHYFFGGQHKSWSAGRDGEETHKVYLKRLHELAQERGLKMESFLPRKGDVLIWHADLPHGGSRIQNRKSRRSLVTHFVPRSVKANYRNVIGADYHELKHPSGHGFSSRHFRMQSIDAQGRAPILFDNDISKQRQKR